MTIALTSDHSLMDVLQKLPTPVIICDTTTGEMLWAHMPDATLVGTSDPSKIVGRNLLEFLSPDQHAVALRDVARIASGEEFVSPVIYRLTRMDGGTSSVHISTTQVSFNGTAAMLSVLADVTDREQTLRDLQDSEERYRSLIESLPEALVISTGPDILFVNQAAVTIFGAKDAGELVGRSVYEFAEGEARDAIAKRQRRIYRTGGTLPQVSMPLKSLDGTRFNGILNSTLVRWHGELAMQTLVRVDTDVTP